MLNLKRKNLIKCKMIFNCNKKLVSYRLLFLNSFARIQLTAGLI